MYDKIVVLWVQHTNKLNELGRRVETDDVVNVKIAVSLPEEGTYIRLVRQMGRALLEHHAAQDQDIDEIETLVGELCANVTRHARSETGIYLVEIVHHGDQVVVTVTDYGQGFDPAQITPVGTDRRDTNGGMRHGGYGLQLVSALADHVEFQTSQPQGTTVRAVKKLRGDHAL